MTPTQTVALVAFVSQLKPAQATDEYTPDAWHEVLGHLNPDDALQAVTQIARREKWIDPSDICKEVARARRERLQHADASFHYTGDPDNTHEYRRQLRNHRRAIGNGQPPAETPQLKQRFQPAQLAGVFRSVPITNLPATPAPASPRTLALMRARLDRATNTNNTPPLEGGLITQATDREQP